MAVLAVQRRVGESGSRWASSVVMSVRGNWMVKASSVARSMATILWLVADRMLMMGLG